MTLTEGFYCKIGRMTVAFGELDFLVGMLVEDELCPGLGEKRPPAFTKRQLEAMRDWAKSREADLGPELASDMAANARQGISLYVRRQDAMHSIWLQESPDSNAWVLKRPRAGGLGVPSLIDANAVEQMTGEAVDLARRVGLLAGQVHKHFAAR